MQPDTGVYTGKARFPMFDQGTRTSLTGFRRFVLDTLGRPPTMSPHANRTRLPGYAPASADTQADAEQGRRDQDDGKCPCERKHSLRARLTHPAEPQIEEILAIALWQQTDCSVNDSSRYQGAAAVEFDRYETCQKRRDKSSRKPGQHVDLLPKRHG